MGEDNAGIEHRQGLPGHLGHLTWDTFPGHIIETYKVGSEADVMELIEQLDGTVMRDQRVTAEFESTETQRKSLHRSAKVIRDEAAKRLPDINRLKDALASFEQAIEPSNWSATMLYEVFDIPFVPSTAVDAPELFDLLRKAIAMRDRIWTQTTVDFEALSELPVRVSAAAMN